MATDDNFRAAYRELERRMEALADADGDVFLPTIEPQSPVDYILICMEPSLGRWARSREEARSRVAAGFRDFLLSTEDFILHFCVRRYLCAHGQRYHITNLSKGAMLVKHAGASRLERYDRWHPLLQEEIELVGTPRTRIMAVGKAVAQFLERREFPTPFATVLHYGGQAGRWRNAAIAGHERCFEAFSSSISIDSVFAAAEEVLSSVSMTDYIRQETLERLRRASLTKSRKQLIYHYKGVFGSLRI